MLSTTWYTTYIVATLTFTAVFFFVLAPLYEPKLMWEAVLYWCMIFIPPLIIFDVAAWIYRCFYQWGKRLLPRGWTGSLRNPQKS